jgi:hypothetical protein
VRETQMLLLGRRRSNCPAQPVCKLAIRAPESIPALDTRGRWINAPARRAEAHRGHSDVAAAAIAPTDGRRTGGARRHTVARRF